MHERTMATPFIIGGLALTASIASPGEVEEASRYQPPLEATVPCGQQELLEDAYGQGRRKSCGVGPCPDVKAHDAILKKRSKMAH